MTTNPLAPPKEATSRPAFLPVCMAALVLVPLAGIVALPGCSLLFEDSEKEAIRRSQRQLDYQLDELKSGKSQQLYLYDTHGTDQLLEQINGMVEIKTLYLEQTDVSDNGMRHVVTLPNLRQLIIYAGQMSDEGLALLKGNQSITSLELYQLRITDDALRVLTEMPNLRSLTVSSEARLDPRLTDAGLANLKDLQNLDKLVISGDWASDGAIDELRSALPDCKITTNAAGR